MPNCFLTHDLYQHIDATGETRFPSVDSVRQNAERGTTTVLILEANVCLELSNYARRKMDVETSFRIRHFLLAIKLAKVDVTPFPGCLELASVPRDKSVNHAKFLQIATNVQSALEQREWSLVHGIFPDQSVLSANYSTTLEGFYSLLRYFYCAFLKVSQIRARGHLRDRAVKNAIEFVDWCEKMESHVAILSQSAVLIFGGSHKVDNLVKVTNKKSVLDASWGAAWDMWHCWMVQNLLGTVKVDGVAQHAILVTHDGALATVASQCIPRTQFTHDSKPFLSISEIGFDAPFYAGKEQRLIEALAERESFDARQRRVHRNINVTPKSQAVRQERVEAEIMVLERELSRDSALKHATSI